eukprot:294055_1
MSTHKHKSDKYRSKSRSPSRSPSRSRSFRSCYSRSRIYFRGLPVHWNYTAMKEYFDEFGTILTINIFDKHPGAGVVSYKNPYSADNCIQESKKRLNWMMNSQEPFYVNYAKANDRYSRSRSRSRSRPSNNKYNRSRSRSRSRSRPSNNKYNRSRSRSRSETPTKISLNDNRKHRKYNINHSITTIMDIDDINNDINNDIDDNIEDNISLTPNIISYGSKNQKIG